MIESGRLQIAGGRDCADAGFWDLKRPMRRLIATKEARADLSADLRGPGRAIVAVEGDGEAPDMLRTARSIELLHGLFAAFRDDRMVEVQGATTLSETDIMLVAAAHQMVSENWQQPLTVGSIARRCGLNKSKLTRGFRDLYPCSVPEAVSERRLGRAREMLAESDLPISTVGYRCGYMNNASFTRAFTRRFGMTPTDMRRSAPRATPGDAAITR